MTESEIEQHLQQLLSESRELGLNLDEDRAREVVAGLVAQAHEHGVTVDEIKRRNLVRELFGGGARPR